MCGIVGAAFNDSGNEGLIASMAQRVAHRGPDEQSLFASGRVVFGFRRLSIIDPAGGHQPVYNESQTVIALCNGEIYNHRDHRQALHRQGHRFGSGSDAEVIPHLYEEHAAAFVDYLHGKFAIAVYDQGRGRLLLARDRLGIKPLYYLQTDEGFYFASEMKAFLQVPEFRPQVDRAALDHILTFKHSLGNECLLAGVQSLRPGHRLEYDLKTGGSTIEQYYQLPRGGAPTPGWEEAQGEVRRLFDRAVLLRLMSDVPLGVALSGGLDSSSVAASVALQSGTPPMTFSVDTGDTVRDLDFARLVADRYKTDHHEIRLVPEDLRTLVPKVMWHAEEPFSVSEIPTHYLGFAAQRHVKVLLCGDGADELFGGYSRFQPINLGSMLPARVLKWGYIRGLNGCTQRERRQLYAPAQLPFLGPNTNVYLDQALGSGEGTVLDRLLRYEMTQQLPQHQLMRLDKLTMAHGVEARVPFLDSDLVAYVATLPSRYKVRGFQEKVLLKHAMADRLPAAIIQRRKYGLSTPVGPLFRNGFADVCREEFLSHRDTLGQYFSYNQLDRLFGAIGKGVLSVPEQKLFQVYLFLKWHQLFIEGLVPSEPAEPVSAGTVTGIPG